MFYWVKLSHWYHGYVEKQFYENEYKNMMKYVQEKLLDGWEVTIKVFNNIKKKERVKTCKKES